MKIKISITKEVLQRSMLCGVENANGGYTTISDNCAVSVALRDVFGFVQTTHDYIIMYKFNHEMVSLPQIASDFITKFDRLVDSPEKRLDLPETDFEIDIPSSIIDQINIENIHKSATLELVN